MSDIRRAFAAELKARYRACIRYDDELNNTSAEQISDELGSDTFISAVLEGKYIKRCKLCGRPFVTSYMKTPYCDRPYDDKHSYRDVGPRITRESDPLIKFFDKARRVHLRRRASAVKRGLPDAEQKYSDWLEYALEREEMCRAGEVTLEEFSICVGRNYEEDI